MLLLSGNEQKVLECIRKNVIIGAKDIIEQTEIPDRTVRRILKNLLIIELLKALEILKIHQIKNTNWQSSDRVQMWTVNANKAKRIGNINKFSPYSKNPKIEKVFKEIGFINEVDKYGEI